MSMSIGIKALSLHNPIFIAKNLSLSLSQLSSDVLSLSLSHLQLRPHLCLDLSTPLWVIGDSRSTGCGVMYCAGRPMSNNAITTGRRRADRRANQKSLHVQITHAAPTPDAHAVLRGMHAREGTYRD